jgi:hypothetical protein
MVSDERLEYIGEVEKEKQKVMAGLDAFNTQEGYQKQIEAQNGQLGAIQENWVSSRNLRWRWKSRRCAKLSRSRRASCRF